MLPTNAPSAALSTLVLPDQLTMQTASQALETLKRELGSQGGPVVAIDAQGLRVLDSSAVAVLLELRRELQTAGLSLSLIHPPQRLSDLVALYGVSELLPS
jgi:phospholipid transport system transporter-binding protein